MKRPSSVRITPSRDSTKSRKDDNVGESRSDALRCSPVPVTISTAITLSAVRPYPSAREPHALLPIIPPIVHRLWVDGSGPNRRRCEAAARCRSSRTTPGSTTAVADSGSMSRIRLRCREKSTTMPAPTALPAIDVPAPRAVIGNPSRRPTSTIAAISSRARGKTTTCGTTRYNDASVEYSARRLAEASTPATPARDSSASTEPVSANVLMTASRPKRM